MLRLMFNYGKMQLQAKFPRTRNSVTGLATGRSCPAAEPTGFPLKLQIFLINLYHTLSLNCTQIREIVNLCNNYISNMCSVRMLKIFISFQAPPPPPYPFPLKPFHYPPPPLLNFSHFPSRRCPRGCHELSTYASVAR